MNQYYDIAIVGGGMVGGMLACALGNSRFRVAVLEAAELPVFDAGGHCALRVSALSVASQSMLKAVGAWQGVIARRACPYRRMLVWDGQNNGQTLFDSADIAQPELGHIVENHVLQIALCERLQQFDNVDFLPSSRIENMYVNERHTRLVLQGGGEITAGLAVGADGGNSKVRALSGIETQGAKYPDQHALVATVETALPQQDITWQRFMPTGPEAFLPLCGHYGSVVWYNTPEEVARLKSVADTVFIDALQQQLPDRLGAITSLVGRGSFPLAHSHARQYVKPRIALVGDAAHTVHPLAGQGVNLGLLDAATLAEVLIDSANSKDAGLLLPLRRYERWRKGHNQMMQTMLDGFYRAFKPQPWIVHTARNAMLTIADKVAPVNHFCMRYASGVAGDLPKLARGIPLV